VRKIGLYVDENAQIEEICALSADGLPPNRIAFETGIPRTIVRRIVAMYRGEAGYCLDSNKFDALYVPARLQAYQLNNLTISDTLADIKKNI
jgi:hypothetical protein